MKKHWSEFEIEYLRSNLASTSRDIAGKLGRSVHSVSVKINKLGLSRKECTPRPGVKSEFTAEQIGFIRENIDQLTNREIAVHLDKTLTVVRNKIYELGLKRNDRADEWTQDQQAFLVQNFRTIGDVELGEIMNEKYPYSNRKFGRRTINKKRKLLGLFRSKEEIEAIISHKAHKARRNTILQNSGSLNYKDGWIAMTLATKNHPERIKTFLKHPELIELKRSQLKLNREIKSAKQ